MHGTLFYLLHYLSIYNKDMLDIDSSIINYLSIMYLFTFCIWLGFILFFFCNLRTKTLHLPMTVANLIIVFFFWRENDLITVRFNLPIHFFFNHMQYVIIINDYY